jgi:MFS family permease
MLNNQFWWIVIGQVIIQCGSPMTTGAISIIANLWFGDKERGRATSFMALSSPFGSFCSFLMQAFYSYRIE